MRNEMTGGIGRRGIDVAADGTAKRRALSKADVLKVFWKWDFASHANYNYERMQASGVLFSMTHIIDRLYPNDRQAKIDFMKRHMQFYNTEPHYGGIVNGLALAMEEERANDPAVTGEAISAIKTGLMGPMAGVGDTLWQGTLQPILLAIGISLASASGSPAGALFFAVAMFAIQTAIGYFFFMTGYRQGKGGVEKLLGGGQMRRLISAASIMGAVVLGALAASYVTASSGFVIQVGEAQLALQADILDKLLKGVIPLAITLGTWYLLKVRKMKSTWVMVALVVVGAVLGATGLLGGIIS